MKVITDKDENTKEHIDSFEYEFHTIKDIVLGLDNDEQIERFILYFYGYLRNMNKMKSVIGDLEVSMLWKDDGIIDSDTFYLTTNKNTNIDFDDDK